MDKIGVPAAVEVPAADVVQMSLTAVSSVYHYEEVQRLRCMEHKEESDSAGYLHTFLVMEHKQDWVVHFRNIF